MLMESDMDSNSSDSMENSYVNDEEKVETDISPDKDGKIFKTIIKKGKGNCCFN